MVARASLVQPPVRARDEPGLHCPPALTAGADGALLASESSLGPLLRARPARPSKAPSSARGNPVSARAAVLTHVATHGMHHRAQCLNMLRRLDVQPLPPSSVSEWTWLGETRV